MLRSIVLLSATQGKTRQRAWCNRVLWQHAASMEAIQARVAEATELPKNSPRESGLSKLLCQQVLAGALQADECMVAASHIVSFFFKLGVGSLAQHCQAVKAFPCSVVSAQASHGAIVWAARGPGGLAAESCGNIFIPCTLSQRPLPKPASQRSQRPRLLFVDLDEEWNESAQQLQAAAGLQVSFACMGSQISLGHTLWFAGDCQHSSTRCRRIGGSVRRCTGDRPAHARGVPYAHCSRSPDACHGHLGLLR